MLLNTVLLQALSLAAYFISTLFTQPLRTLARILSINAADLCYAFEETLLLMAYLAAFMIPAFLFMYLTRNDDRQPLRLEIRLEPETPLVIIAAIGLILPAAYLNSFMVSFMDFSKLFANDRD